MEMFTPNMIQIARWVLPLDIKREQGNFRNRWIDEQRLSRQVLLDIDYSIQIVQDTCKLTTDELPAACTLRLPGVSGASAPFENLLCISVEPDIQPPG